MARPFFAAKHVESMSLLPENLTIGRAYFVDDEQVIVIDHGRGPVIYGNAPGPQGIAGEPIPQLQDQIDALVAEAFTTQKTIWDINKREVQEAEDTASRFQSTHEKIDSESRFLQEAIFNVKQKADNDIAQLLIRHNADIQALTEQHTQDVAAIVQKHNSDFNSLAASIDENLMHSDEYTKTLYDHAIEMTAHNSAAITRLIDTMHEQFGKYDSALQILAKSISELYPEHFAPEDSQDDPLDNETVSTDSGSWVIQQTTLKDGTIVLNLTPQEQVIDSLKAGDSVTFDGDYWTVQDISTSEGVTTITLKP